MVEKPIKLDSWVRELIVDPLSKEPLKISDDGRSLISPFGRIYPINGLLFDLRLLNNETTPDQIVWEKGQHEYEKWSKVLASQDQTQDYDAEIEGVEDVYREIPIEGRCLDVGGHQGRLRETLNKWKQL